MLNMSRKGGRYVFDSARISPPQVNGNFSLDAKETEIHVIPKRRSSSTEEEHITTHNHTDRHVDLRQGQGPRPVPRVLKKDRIPRALDILAGKGVIINNEDFDQPNLSSRRCSGNSTDVSSVYSRFIELGFSMDLKPNLTKREIFEIFDNIQNDESYRAVQAFVCVILTHGEEDELWAKDEKYQVEDLMEKINSINCRCLQRKPKMFIVQACRGRKLEKSALLDEEDMVTTDAGADLDHGVYNAYVRKIQPPRQPRINIPADIDFIHFYSSLKGKGSLRNTLHGAPFIQILCDELKEIEDKEEIFDVLTRVQANMAYLHDNSGDDNTYEEFKQTPCFVSTMTFKSYFVAQ